MFTIGELKEYIEENNLSDDMPVVIDDSHINGIGFCVQNPAVKETPHLSLTSERKWNETQRIKSNTLEIFAMEGILFEDNAFENTSKENVKMFQNAKICKDCGCNMQPQEPPDDQISSYFVCPQCSNDFSIYKSRTAENGDLTVEIEHLPKEVYDHLSTGKWEPPKRCKGIYVACDAPAVDGRDYCAECWNAGEDLAREEQMLDSGPEPDTWHQEFVPDETAGDETDF